MARDGATIFALSSGAPPAAIGVIRVTGVHAAETLAAFAGHLPPPRYAQLAALSDPADGGLIDRALILWFPGPRTATGEDLAELHVHGGRAVVAAILSALARRPGLRLAEPGEFTRRAFENGRIDLAEAESLADLLAAETELQRRTALLSVEGHLAARIAGWRAQLTHIVAVIEAIIEFSEDDETIATAMIAPGLAFLGDEIDAALASPPAERLRDGIRVVIAGPPNAGKSSLLNALVGRKAALVSPIPGTTRDVIEAPMTLEGLPFLLCDTAGLRESTDTIELLGIVAARDRAEQADVLLWLGAAHDAPLHGCCIKVGAKIDVDGNHPSADVQTSATTGEGMAQLRELLRSRTSGLLNVRDPSLSVRQRQALVEARRWIGAARDREDYVIMAEEARQALDALAPNRPVAEDVLDALFSRFCIGK